MTVLELIERSSARLEASGVSFATAPTNAFDEAAWLVLWRLGLPLDSLDAHAARNVSAGEQAPPSPRAAAHHQPPPAAYLTGEAWLRGVPFFRRRGGSSCRDR